MQLTPNVAENHYQLALTYARLGLSDKSKAEMERYTALRSDTREQSQAKTAASPASAAQTPEPPQSSRPPTDPPH